VPDKEMRTEPPVPVSEGVDPGEPTEERRPIAADASAAKPEAEPRADGYAGLTMKTNTRSERILHPEEMFVDVPQNNAPKARAFSDYNKAVRAVEQAEARFEQASTERERAATERRLTDARQKKEQALEAVKKIIVRSRVAKDRKKMALTEQLRAAEKSHAGAERLAQLRADLAAYVKDLEADAMAKTDAMTHTEVGHETESVFEPVETDVHTFDVTFPDGESEKLKDRRVAYATVAPEGVEGVQPSRDKDAAREEVRATMKAAGLSASEQRILEMISGFEGGFDAVNTYDKKMVTWGFVQWAGGDHSDLTEALTFIKARHPDAFRRQLQDCGIDVEKQMLVVKRAEGESLKGDAAAKAIQEDPKLAAVLMHAGQNPEIRKGEVGAAVALEIVNLLAATTKAGEHKVALNTLFTSEYAVGRLANTGVHSGRPTAKSTVAKTLASYVKAHPYQTGEEWLAGAEAACIDALAALDADRAKKLGKLDHSRGSYEP